MKQQLRDIYQPPVFTKSEIATSERQSVSMCKLGVTQGKASKEKQEAKQKAKSKARSQQRPLAICLFLFCFALLPFSVIHFLLLPNHHSELPPRPRGPLAVGALSRRPGLPSMHLRPLPLRNHALGLAALARAPSAHAHPEGLLKYPRQAGRESSVILPGDNSGLWPSTI